MDVHVIDRSLSLSRYSRWEHKLWTHAVNAWLLLLSYAWKPCLREKLRKLSIRFEQMSYILIKNHPGILLHCNNIRLHFRRFLFCEQSCYLICLEHNSSFNLDMQVFANIKSSITVWIWNST